MKHTAHSLIMLTASPKRLLNLLHASYIPYIQTHMLTFFTHLLIFFFMFILVLVCTSTLAIDF